MCGVTAIRADLRVSIQTRGTADIEAGHLGVGLLVDSDAVLVAAPPAPLWSDTADLEVLIIPRVLQLETAVERFRLRKLVTTGVGLGTPGAGPPMAAFITLHGTSRYAAQVGPFDRDALRSAILRAGGDMRTALLTLGVVSAEQFEIPPGLLTEATRVEREQAEPRRTVYSAGSLVELLDRAWCPIPFFCPCIPGGPSGVAATAPPEEG